MNCLVVAATAKEIEPFLETYRDNQPGVADIDILITGVGLMATTFALTRQLRIKRPGFIIQAGLAGSFDPSIQLGTVFVVKRDTVADLGVTGKNSLETIFDLGLARPDDFPFSKGWLVNDPVTLRKLSLKKVTAVSCNEISTSKEKIKFYKKKFNPVIESMEGAALHYVGLMEKIPFIQLRSVSNYIGERNKSKWKLKESIFNLNKELTRLLYSL